MRLIQYTWGSNSDNILNKNLIELGHEVTVYDKKCEHYTKDLKFAQGLVEVIHESNAEGVISNDFFPIISMVCKTTGILYYSWVYDSPHYTLFAATSKYPCNRIGCFDRALTERLNGLGIATVKHIPLGVDWNDVSDPEKSVPMNKAKYYCDVSFVGSLYSDTYNYYDELCNDPVVKKKADACIAKQCFEYKKDYFGNFVNDNTCISDTEDGEGSLEQRIKTILVSSDLLPGDEYLYDMDYIFISHFLDKKVTVEERKQLLTAVAKKECNFTLYTGSDIKKYPVLVNKNRGYVDYNTQMPQVFRNSRINLNITLRSIKTGIPLRALDIMGCGGFLLSNYQEELAESFKENKELVLFYGLEDCLDKIDYYLAHEEERSKIAAAGRAAVKERFNYKDQLEKLLTS